MGELDLLVDHTFADPGDALDACFSDGVSCLTWSPRTSMDLLASQLAVAVRSRATLRVQDRESARPRSLSGQHGYGAFPWHTDAATQPRPPRLMFMRSLGRPRTPTLLLDARAVIWDDDLRRQLSSGSWLIRGAIGSFHVPVIDSRALIRFNPDVMSPASRGAHIAHAATLRMLAEARPLEHRWRPGEVLLVDNGRMLHSRPQVTAEDHGRRCLERILGDASDRVGL